MSNVIRFGLVRHDSNDKDATALIQAFTEAEAVILKLKASRQRSLAISTLEEAFLHAVLASVKVDSPIRMA